MNSIPLCELKALRRIEAHFDGAYVSLLTKLGQLYPEQSVLELSEQLVSSEQGDELGGDATTSDQSDNESSDGDSYEKSNEEKEASVKTSEFQQFAPSLKPELISLALSFAKLFNKNLLANERVAQLESQVYVLQRQVCTLRAIAANSHELCLTSNSSQEVAAGALKKQSESSSAKKQLKTNVSNLIAFKAAVEQEMDCLFEEQNKSMQRMERKYKNKIYGLTLAMDYMRKELAGRIQQMQIYDAVYNRAQDEKHMTQMSRIWTQLVYQIALNRHKTIVRLTDAASKTYLEEDDNETSDEQASIDSEIDDLCTLITKGCPSTGPQFVNYSQLGQVHYLSIFIEKNKPVGLIISGGAEWHMPLIIQKVEVGSVAAACGQLSRGDIILSIQNFDMIGTTQDYAVQLIKSMSGWVRFGIVRIPVDSIEDTLANRQDFNFELLYDNFPSDSVQQQSEPVDATDEETDTASESELGEGESEASNYAKSE